MSVRSAPRPAPAGGPAGGPSGGPAGAGSSPAGGQALGQRRVLIIFAGLVLAILLSALDQTVVSTALPTIAGDLHGLNQLSWVITAYLLAATVTIPIYGKIGDLFGRKNVFIFSIVVFLVGSALSGTSQSMLELILFRALQGVGAGGIMIGAQAIIGEVISARDRGRYMSIMMPMIGVATVIGPLVGGFLTQHASWRWIFYINLPIGAVALAVIGVGLKLPKIDRQPVIDYWGTALLAAGVSCIVLLASLGGTTFAWASGPVIGLAVAAVVLLVAFARVEGRVKEPIMPLRLFRNPIFAVSIGLGFAVGFAMIGAVSYLPTFLQLVGGASATNSGILLLPLVAGMMTASVVTGQLISRTGRYKVFPILGTATSAAGLYLLSTMGPATTSLSSSIYMVVLGLGLGLIMPVLTLVVQNAVSFQDLGVATSGVNFFRQIGGSIGVALAGTLFTSRLATQLVAHLPAGAAHGAAAHAAGITPAALRNLPPAVHHGFVVAFANSLPPVFLDFTPLLVAAFVLSWFLIEKPLSTRAHASREAGQPAADQVAGQVAGVTAAEVAVEVAAEVGEQTARAGASAGAAGLATAARAAGAGAAAEQG
ncbi:MAG: MDR family MFS transporter, partial [Acidimicrobiales bacterium]